MLTIRELTKKINDKIDPEELIDILGLSIEDLTVQLEEIIIENKHKFRDLEDDGPLDPFGEC